MSLRQERRFSFDVGGFDGPPDPFDEGGGGGRFPRWSKYMIAYLVGAISASALIFTPLFVPALVAAGLAIFTVVAAARRLR